MGLGTSVAKGHGPENDLNGNLWRLRHFDNDSIEVIGNSSTPFVDTKTLSSEVRATGLQILLAR